MQAYDPSLAQQHSLKNVNDMVTAGAATGMHLRLLGLSLAAGVAAAPSAEPGLKIVTRQTTPEFLIETTRYVQADRAREDWRIVRAATDQSGGTDHWTSRIVRCDLQKYILLNHSDRIYATSPLRPYSWAHSFFFFSLGSRKPAPPKPPNLLIETTTVRTGEQKAAFGYTARRVITTTRRIPLAEGVGESSEAEMDAWYIDIETEPSCERREANGAHAVLFAVASGSSDPGHQPQPPVITFKEVGERERGYPIETTTRSRSSIRSNDGGIRELKDSAHRVVTQLSTEPLDPAVFEIPAGFRPGQGRIAAFLAYWSDAWQMMREFAAAMFH